MNCGRKTGGGSCSVAVCPSPLGVTYHTLPKDPERRALWIAACKRLDPINLKTARICSNHFKEEDYERDLRNELLNLPQRKLLKPNAVPTERLFPKEIVVTAATAERLQITPTDRPAEPKRGRKRKVVADSLPAKTKSVGEDSDSELFEAEFDHSDSEFVKSEFIRMRSQVKYLEAKLQEQQKELIALRKFKQNCFYKA